MTYEITGGELSGLEWWRQSQPPGPLVDATVDGFLWCLSIVSGAPVTYLRGLLNEHAGAFSPTPVASPSPEGTPGWQGLGIPRIDGRQHVVEGDEPVGRSRAWSTGPDGRPMAVGSSYADAAARGLLADTEGAETPPEV